MREKRPLPEHIAASFRDAFRGLRAVWREERNFRIEVLVALLLIVVMKLTRFSYGEASLVILASTMVLAAEVTNTALEDTMNKIEPNHDPAIGRIKDVAAGVVVVNVLGALIIGLVVFAHHFLK